MPSTGPGKRYRKGISFKQLCKIFPDDKAAQHWFEECRWGEAGKPDVFRCVTALTSCDPSRRDALSPTIVARVGVPSPSRQAPSCIARISVFKIGQSPSS